VAKEFITRYRGFRISGQVPDYPKYLLGTASTHNTAKQLAKPCVRLVGNQAAALQVISCGRPLGAQLDSTAPATGQALALAGAA
jgi:hypothetical protein